MYEERELVKIIRFKVRVLVRTNTVSNAPEI